MKKSDLFSSILVGFLLVVFFCCVVSAIENEVKQTESKNVERLVNKYKAETEAYKLRNEALRNIKLK